MAFRRFAFNEMLACRSAIRAQRLEITGAVVACFLAGCCTGPHVTRFDAQPAVLCEGETAVMRWDASGELAMAMQTEPVQPAQDACAEAGRDTVKLTLVARKKGEED